MATPRPPTHALASRALLLAAAGIALTVIAGHAGCVGCAGEQSACGAQPCPEIPGCKGLAVCEPKHVCEERTCEGLSWICSKSPEGRFEWVGKYASCDDGDACTTNDQCAGGRCLGAPKECRSPPGNACSDARTLRSYSGLGACAAGQCGYAHTDVACPKGCASGACEGDPCLGVKCDNPPGPCYKAPGSCSAGKCSYEPAVAGTPCSVADKCVVDPVCDTTGSCKGSGVGCTRPNARGGTCVSGACQGFTCEPGYGNCNNDWDDGCEALLNTEAHCGTCGRSCPDAPHAAGKCQSGGQCGLLCRDPYQDCDGDAKNGCEIPVGVPNGCGRSGLGANRGCGTAWCGAKASGTLSQNFGTWHCSFCSHCHKYASGYSWCLYESGLSGVFSTETCASCCSDGQADKSCAK
ncbi:MAG: hypothetical protein IT371_05445 [Deltaproteobacteria bacterium]|nr:hypothetical protein [Deltaproteobacteria bacterium]